MTKREIAALAIRLLGIYTFILAIDTLALMANTSFMAMQAMARMRTASPMSMEFTLLACLPPVLSTVAGFILWFGADRIASRIIHEDGAILPSTIGGMELRELALSIMGIITIVQAATPITRAAATFYFDYANPIFHQATHQNTAIIGLSGLIELCIGFWLLLKAGTLNNWIASIQSPKAAEVEVE